MAKAIPKQKSYFDQDDLLNPDIPKVGPEPPRLLSVQVKGFRGIEFQEVKLSREGVVTVQGPNKGGKSSAVAAIEWLFRGRRLYAPPDGRVGERSRPNRMVHDGKEEAEVSGFFEDGYKLTRKVDDAGNESLTLRDQDKRAADAAALVRDWVSAWSFSALRLVRAVNAHDTPFWMALLLSDSGFKLTAAERTDYKLYKTEPIEILAELKAAEERQFAVCGAVRKRKEEARARFEGIVLEPDTPDAEPKATKKQEEKAKLVQWKITVEEQRKRIQEERDTIARARKVLVSRIALLTSEIDQKQEAKREAEQQAEGNRKRDLAIEKQLASLQFPQEDNARLVELEEELSRFQSLYAKWLQREAQRLAGEEQGKEVALLETEERRLAKVRAFRGLLANRAKLPVERVMVQGEDLMVNEGTDKKPVWRAFQDTNDSEQLLTAVEIAAAVIKARKKLPLVVVYEASQFTRDSYKRLIALAKTLEVLCVCEHASDSLRELGQSDVWVEVE